MLTPGRWLSCSIHPVCGFGRNLGHGKTTVEAGGLVERHRVRRRATPAARKVAGSASPSASGSMNRRSTTPVGTNRLVTISTPVRSKMSPRAGLAVDPDPGLLLGDLGALRSLGHLDEPQPDPEHAEHGNEDRGHHGEPGAELQTVTPRARCKSRAKGTASSASL